MFLYFLKLAKDYIAFSLVVASFGHDEIKPLSGTERV
jgi:hypothetical protein